MKRIDFHIHTISSPSDEKFEFDMGVLKEYVSELKLDAIAITNHNLFNLKQYEEIRDELNIDVFPGVEVDLEKGHILLITSDDKVDEFSIACDKLQNEIKTAEDYIDFEKFTEIFTNYKEYILIPHFEKAKALKEETRLKFGSLITCGEVRNAKKFTTSKEAEEVLLVPVLFSDFRSRKREEITDKDGKLIYPIKMTYLDIGEISFNGIKLALSDNSHVHCNEQKTAKEFQILSDGTFASTKLNLIVGSRSSGKTYTLDKIKESFGDDDRVKYIEQFEIVKECNEENFNKMIEKDCDQIVEEYQKPLKSLIDKIVKIDDGVIDDNIENYISTLKEFASQTVDDDIYSKTAIFSEPEFILSEPTEAKNIVESLIELLLNKKYKDTIDKYIDRNKISMLIKEMTLIRNKERKEYILKVHTNTILGDLKRLLSRKSAKTSPANCDFTEAGLGKALISRFDSTLAKYMSKYQISSKKLPKFSLNISKYPFRNATNLKKTCKLGSLGLVEEFSFYNLPYQYMRKLKAAGVQTSELYKCFVGFEHSVLNEAGVKISGGERAEYKLEKEIRDASRYDVLLIDEPESGFDNIFIKNDIIKMIKEISNKTIVFLVTHNNTLGPLLQPNWIICNKYEDGDFKVYSGPFDSKKLETPDGKEIPNIDVLLDTMEAGEQAYEDRRGIYESIKN